MPSVDSQSLEEDRHTLPSVILHPQQDGFRDWSSGTHRIWYGLLSNLVWWRRHQCKRWWHSWTRISVGRIAHSVQRWKLWLHRWDQQDIPVNRACCRPSSAAQASAANSPRGPCCRSKTSYLHSHATAAVMQMMMNWEFYLSMNKRLTCLNGSSDPGEDWWDLDDDLCVAQVCTEGSGHIILPYVDGVDCVLELLFAEQWSRAWSTQSVSTYRIDQLVKIKRRCASPWVRSSRVRFLKWRNWSTWVERGKGIAVDSVAAPATAKLTPWVKFDPGNDSK